MFDEINMGSIFFFKEPKTKAHDLPQAIMQKRWQAELGQAATFVAFEKWDKRWWK